MISPHDHADLMVGRLAGRANIPVTGDTLGWAWLIDIRDNVLEAVPERIDDEPLHDILHHCARATVPEGRTEELWQTFVDVEGWREPVHLYQPTVPKPEKGGVTQVCKVVLETMARRVAEATAEVAWPDLLADAGLVWLDEAA